MGKRLQATSDSVLERVAHDPRLSDAARRAARKELERREHVPSHCPRGRGCTDWTCEAVH